MGGGTGRECDAQADAAGRHWRRSARAVPEREMTTLIIPTPDGEPWPTLGPGVCSFIEEYLIHGPGDLRGAPVQLSEEQRALIFGLYEVYPEGHPQAGRR